MCRILTVLVTLEAALARGAAHAAIGSTTASSISFGSVSLRARATNQTFSNLSIGNTLSSLWVVTFGAGSGRVGGSLSPRDMRHAAGTTLSYELRPSGSGTRGYTWTWAFVLVLLTGRGGATLADFTSLGPATGTGAYASTFSHVSQASMTRGVALCGLDGTIVAGGRHRARAPGDDGSVRSADLRACIRAPRARCPGPTSPATTRPVEQKRRHADELGAREH